MKGSGVCLDFILLRHENHREVKRSSSYLPLSMLRQKWGMIYMSK